MLTAGSHQAQRIENGENVLGATICCATRAILGLASISAHGPFCQASTDPLESSDRNDNSSVLISMNQTIARDRPYRGRLHLSELKGHERRQMKVSIRYRGLD